MCYSGYNVEDAIIVNRGALKRGLFNTTYYNIYESEEEKQENALENIVKFFTSFDNKNIKGMKPGYDYSNLDKETGLIKENTPVDDRTVMIGKVMMDKNKPDTYNDVSVLPKKGQTGFVDKAFITVNGKGNKIAKIRCRGERIPMIGDKFCSRAGQKGTVGIILDEENMPFTKDGIRPDIIVNPHAMPSRMTIGHLVESQQSKACSMFGYFGDCTAFVNDGSKYKVLLKA
jgi:DNA-directed RNA polymerase beta subunit